MRHGSNIDPPNRFLKTINVSDLEQVADDEDYLKTLAHRPIEYFEDQSETIVSHNESPDVPFNYSLNPYRGCIHACAYCYARPSHEYLGFNAGLDFETKIVVKLRAAELFRKFLAKPTWIPEPINFSGVTDCYQPAERKFRLTRGCLEVARECNQPLSIVTKNALVTRDIDLLQPMAKRNLIHIFVSVTTLDNQLASNMEPRTSVPAARLRAIRQLSQSGIPVGVMVAPIIPGLNDAELPKILETAREYGAEVAGYVLIRLPLSVEPVFTEWIQRVHPAKAEMVLGRIKQCREGKLNDSTWGSRMVGSGVISDQINQLFKVFRKTLGYQEKFPPHNCDDFVPPLENPRQRRLF